MFAHFTRRSALRKLVQLDSRKQRTKRRVTFEALEDRTVLAGLNVSNGTLIYLANSAGLTVSTTGPGGTYTLADNQPFVLFPGAVSAGWTTTGNTATGPDNSITAIQLNSNETDDTFNIQSVDASVTMNTGAGNDNITVSANGIPSADSVAINNTTTNGSDTDTLTFDTGGTQGTLGTGSGGSASYQAAGHGLTTFASVKSGFMLFLTNVASNSLNLNINSQITTPTALQTTITNSSGSLSWNTKTGGNTIFADSLPVSVLNNVSVAGTTGGEILTLDYSGGDPLPASGLTYDPPAVVATPPTSLTSRGAHSPAKLTRGLARAPAASPTTAPRRSGFQTSRRSPTRSPRHRSFSRLRGAATVVNVNTGPIVSGTQTDQINDGGTASFELLNFANKTAVNVDVPAAAATSTVNIPTIAAGLTTLSVTTGIAGANNGRTFQAIPTGLTVNVDTGSGSGSTTNVGLGGSLAAIGGPVFVKSTRGLNTLALDDSGRGSGQTYTIAGSKVTATSFPTSVDFSGGGITTLSLTSAGLGDTFNFTGPVQSGVTIYKFSADSGAGPNTLKVTSSVSALDMRRLA